MTSFNESIKKTEDKLERVITNQQTFSSKLESIEKNSSSKLNLTPVSLNENLISTKVNYLWLNSNSNSHSNLVINFLIFHFLKDLISGIKDALDIDFEIEFDVKPKIKSTKAFTSISSNPKAITLD